MIADLDHVNDFWIFIEENDEFTFDDDKPLSGKLRIREQNEFRKINICVYGYEDKKIKILRNENSCSELTGYSIYLPKEVILEVSQEGSFSRRIGSSPNLTHFGIFICRIHENSQHYQQYIDLQMILNDINN